MPDPNTDETKEIPKKRTNLIPILSEHVIYCNTTLLQLSKEEAVLSFISGPGVAAEFAFSLPHLKRLYDILGKNLKSYEDKYGAINPNKDDVEDVRKLPPTE